ncbi:alpha-amylase family glycosyl hydrolase [Amycolatopsis sp. cmx-11-12]|uniref:alpha-amylase family glycosyl hydrolase n=1 Tax=Amycolatopsis sp. cmx-11-12 TaxID=2785795 RepID=UPI00391859D8
MLYQIYLRSFADSNGDGIGDLRGVIERLDYLSWLGVDGIWLSPVTVSPNADWGYDVAEYCAVHPDLGTLDDIDELITEAYRRNIRVLLDLIPNHTSDQHPWFQDARTSRTARHRDFYIWADPTSDGSPPNNWHTGAWGPAWTHDIDGDQVYYHSFSPGQPDLNWWNDEVRAEFDTIQRFWYGRGIAGFRLDTCDVLIKDRQLRDNPPSTVRDHLADRLRGQRRVYNSNRPEVHDILRHWRSVADSYPSPRLLFGETVVPDIDTLAGYYGTDDELHLTLNVPFQESDLTAASLSTIVDAVEHALPPGAWPLWSGSNHDISRMASRWGAGNPEKTRLALMLLLTLRGTPLLYQGDEIGLTDTPLDHSDLRDPFGIALWPAHPGRDPARTPMPWSNQPGAGFTTPGAAPWLPLGDYTTCNVADQRGQPNSTLNLVRDLIALRRASPDLHSGDYTRLNSPYGTWMWRRGENTIIALNFSDTNVTLTQTTGAIVLSTQRHRDGTAVAGSVELQAHEGIVLHTTPPNTTTAGSV